MAIVIPYVKQTWTDGASSASAARFGVIEEGILDVSQGPAVRVFHNTTQSINSATETALNFNSERFDQAGGVSAAQHDTVTNNTRLTCIYAGIYQITGTFGMAAGGAGTMRVAAIRLNGATELARSTISALNSTTPGITVSTLYSLAVNDYVELTAFQDTGGALSTVQAGNWSPEFMMVRVG